MLLFRMLMHRCCELPRSLYLGWGGYAQIHGCITPSTASAVELVCNCWRGGLCMNLWSVVAEAGCCLAWPCAPHGALCA